MIKTYFSDYALQDSLALGDYQLEEVINLRQAKYNQTVEYYKMNEEAKQLFDTLRSSYPEAKKIINELEDATIHLECINFSAAYRDGMTDLMTALTFNKQEYTKCERLGEGD